jgi:hypothetical protein
MKTTTVKTINGTSTTLTSDDTLTLAFEGMIESTSASLSEFIARESLLKIARESDDSCERNKSAQALLHS